MTFLKKLGVIVAQVVQVATGLGPIVKWSRPGDAATVDKVLAELSELAGIIATVEAIGNSVTSPLPGPEKLKAAAPLVAQALMRSSVVAGKKIANQALFLQGSTKIADGMADILNSLHEDAVKPVDPQDL